MRKWQVGGALVEDATGVLLVRNQRRDGRLDWSPPGGVIDSSDDSLIAGLTREVVEETGLRVTKWEGPVYRVEVVAPEMDWHLQVEVHRALEFDGEIRLDDPDGIVDEAAFFSPRQCCSLLEQGARWLHEPISEWLEERWAVNDVRHYRYEARGSDRTSLVVERAFDL